MELYQRSLGGVLVLMTYGEAPGGAEVSPQHKDWIIHARLQMKLQVLMASDTRPGLPVTQGNNVFVSINSDSAQEAEQMFQALGQGGTIDMPLQETFFAIRFGMLTDPFGIKWMVNVEKPKTN